MKTSLINFISIEFKVGTSIILIKLVLFEKSFQRYGLNKYSKSNLQQLYHPCKLYDNIEIVCITLINLDTTHQINKIREHCLYIIMIQ